MFTLYKIENGRMNVPEPLKFTVGASAVKQGQALVLTGGLLVSAGATTMPTFIAMSDGATGTDIAVAPVSPDQLYKVQSTVSLSSIKPGDKVTIADGLKITATTTSGVATIVSVDADKIATVRFK